MKKALLLVVPLAAGLVWYAAGVMESPGPVTTNAASEADVSAGSAISSGDDRDLPRRPATLRDSTAQDVETMNRAENLARQGLYREALELLPPELAASNPVVEEQRTNIYMRWKIQQRDDRIIELTRLFESAPEDATFQRYKISRELFKLAPEQPVYAELAAEYGELWRLEQLQTGKN